MWRSLVLVLLVLAPLACTTGNQVDWEQATEAVIFIDLVLTKLEAHGIDIAIVYDYVTATITEEREADPTVSPNDVYETIIQRLLEKAEEQYVSTGLGEVPSGN